MLNSLIKPAFLKVKSPKPEAPVPKKKILFGGLFWNELRIVYKGHCPLEMFQRVD